jgi:PAS domain S-box-containing protein
MKIKAKNRIRIFLFTILLVFVNIFFIQASSVNSETIIADTLILGSEPNYPPFCILDKNGNPDGFSVELFKAVAKAAGFEVKIKIGTWSIIRTELENGLIDVLPIVGKIPERENIYDFSMPYTSVQNAVFVRKGTNSFKSLNDLKDKEFAVMKDDNSELFLRRENITDKIFTTSTFEEVIIQLANGEHDAVLMQRLTGLELLDKMNIKNIEPLNLGSSLLKVDYCFAVRKGNIELLSRINEGLAIVIANNSYTEIHDKWFGPAFFEKLSFTDVLKIGVLIFVPLAIIMSLLLIFLLRKQVKRRTSELLDEMAGHKKTLETVKYQRLKIMESEKEIRLLLDSTAEGIYSVNTLGNCTLINKSALQMLGYTRESDIVGHNIHDLVHHKQPDGSACSKEQCRVNQTFTKGLSAHVQNEVFWRKDNSSFHIEYFSHPIIENGKTIGTVVTFWDITTRKKAEQELQKLNNELENLVNLRTAELEEKVQKLNRNQKAMLYMIEDLNLIAAELKEEREKLELINKELNSFSYSVSHDLRSPLRAIDGFSRFLMEDNYHQLDDEGKRLLTVIRENTIKMDELITSILNLSRVSRTELHLSRVDMRATAQSMYLEIATDDEKKDFELEIAEMPTVFCDYALIKQVWQNLIGNALKYSSKSEIKKIEIGCFEDEKMLAYFVKDYGAGFDSAYKDKLFGAFQRLHKSSEFEGNGVGLAIVKRIIHRHNGTINAESKLNKGATFYFSLPKKTDKNLKYEFNH